MYPSKYVRFKTFVARSLDILDRDVNEWCRLPEARMVYIITDATQDFELKGDSIYRYCRRIVYHTGENV